MSGTVIDVDPEHFADAAHHARTVRLSVQSAHDTWTSALAAGEGMAGCDDAGAQFAAQYDDAAGQVARSLENLDTALSQVQTGLEVSGYNHAMAEWSARAEPGAAPETVSTIPATTGNYARPALAFGGTNEGLPPGLELFTDILWSMWPQGDVDALKRAVSAWRALSTELGDIARDLDTIRDRLGRAVSPEIPLIEAHLDTLVTGTRGLADAAEEIADAVHQFCSGPDGIEETVEASWREVRSVVAEVTAAVGISFLATFITAGASNLVGGALAAGRVASGGARIVMLIASLGTRAGALAGRAGVAAVKVLGAGQRFQGVMIRGGAIAGRGLTVAGGGTTSSLVIEGVVHGKDADYASAALWGAGGSVIGDVAGNVLGKPLSRLLGHGLDGPGSSNAFRGFQLSGGLSNAPDALNTVLVEHRSVLRTVTSTVDGRVVTEQVTIPMNRYARAGSDIQRAVATQSRTTGGHSHFLSDSDRNAALYGDSVSSGGFAREIPDMPPSFSNRKAGERIRLLSVDPDAPYGYGPAMHPLDKTGYHSRYTDPRPDPETNIHWSRYPPHDGMVPGSGRFFDDLAAFAEHNPTISLDRIGGKKGSFFGLVEDGVPASVESRSMDPRVTREAEEYSEFRLAPEFPPGAKGWLLHTSRAAPGFGQLGGAGQAVILKPVPLEKITDPEVLARVAERGLTADDFNRALTDEFPLAMLYKQVSQKEALDVGVILSMPTTKGR